MSWLLITAAWGQQTICLPELGVPCDFATINAAITAAPPEVPTEYIVYEGTFVENDLFVRTRRHVTLRGVGAVTIRASTASSTFTVLDGSTLVLRGVTLSGTNGRGARVGDGGRLELYDSVVFTVGIVSEGAGVLVQNGDLRVADSLFLDCSAVSRGGHVSAIDSHLFIERTSFVGGLAGDGGAVFVVAPSGPETATFRDVDFQDNRATSRGGGLFVEGQVALTLDGATFTSNFARDGGALATGLVPGADVRAFDSRFEENQADGVGGAVYLSASDVELEDVELLHNDAQDAGGAIDVDLGAMLTLKRAFLCGNHAAEGGAVRSRSVVPQTWSNNRFVDNEADQGGALAHENATLRLSHHSFLGNEAGQGAALQATGRVELRDSLVAWHSGSVALVPLQDGLLDERYVVTWGNLLGNRPDAVGAGPGARQADPLLRSYQPGAGCAAVDDFHSWYGSLVNAGDPNEADDPDGSAPDIGAWGGPEASPEVWAGDIDHDGFIPLYDCLEGDSFIFPDPDLTDDFTHDKPYDGVDQDCDGGDDFDFDRDGVQWPADCNDFDADVFPGAPEAVGQGDANCDGLLDADGDGVPIDEDCDDSDPRIHPGVAEDPDPLVDRDCDGVGDVVRPLVPAACATGAASGSWSLLGAALLAFRRRAVRR